MIVQFSSVAVFFTFDARDMSGSSLRRVQNHMVANQVGSRKPVPGSCSNGDCGTDDQRDHDPAIAGE